MAKQTKTTSSAELTADELNEREAVVAQKETELKALKSDLQEREEALNSKENKTTVKVEPGLEFKFDGLPYKFEDTAPKSIRINGQVFSQKEIVKDQDLLLQLVAGNSSLIKKL